MAKAADSRAAPNGAISILGPSRPMRWYRADPIECVSQLAASLAPDCGYSDLHVCSRFLRFRRHLRQVSRNGSPVGVAYWRWRVQQCELGRTQEAEPLEVEQARMAIEAIAKPTKPLPAAAGQGFGLTAPERKTVEVHTMGMAKAWLVAHGYENIQDVSGSQSCDFWAQKEGVDHYVEVKGTTGGFGTVLLTANEVDLHRDLHPDNILIVVHNIDLVDRKSRAIGGQVVVLEAWDITTAELRPLSYSCRLVVP